MEDGPRVQASVAHVKDLDEAPGFGLASSALDIAATWGREAEDGRQISVFLSGFQIKK